MNYKEVFAIKKDNNQKSNEYELNNYDSFEPKLEKEFYYEYFRRELLFEVSIMKIEEFLDFQISNCEKPERLIKIIKRKLMPDGKTIISNAEVDLFSGPFAFDIDLGNDFIEIEGVIFSTSYKMTTLLHLIAWEKLQNDVLERLSIIEEYLRVLSASKVSDGIKKLKWIGKPSHLAFIVNNLIEYGYVQKPEKMNGDLNISELSRNISNSFLLEKDATSTLIEYSKESSLSNIKLVERFEKKGFVLPGSWEF